MIREKIAAGIPDANCSLAVPPRFTFEWIDYHDEQQSSRIIRQTADLFAAYGSDLVKVRALAEKVTAMIEELSPFIEKNTAAVCPSCTSVCCINRHSWHEQQDLVLLFALGAEAPSCQTGTDHSAPCRFLGEYGCTVTRSLRPYRCTWYFCVPLLEHIHEVPGREYRAFVRMLEGLTLGRERMLREFAAAVDAANLRSSDSR